MTGNAIVEVATPRLMTSAQKRNLPTMSGPHNTHSYKGGPSNNCSSVQGVE